MDQGGPQPSLIGCDLVSERVFLEKKHGRQMVVKMVLVPLLLPFQAA